MTTMVVNAHIRMPMKYVNAGTVMQAKHATVAMPMKPAATITRAAPE
ncbi:MAG: hypothetical protein KJ773_03065 [Candidatus Thermoplasmatota archaeon]|nr:hypothetical protein [Candidatus Thermoplasmatota archaeon]